MTLLSDLKDLEKLWDTSRDLMRQAYVAKFAFRKAQKDLTEMTKKSHFL